MICSDITVDSKAMDQKEGYYPQRVTKCLAAQGNTGNCNHFTRLHQITQTDISFVPIIVNLLSTFLQLSKCLSAKDNILINWATQLNDSGLKKNIIIFSLKAIEILFLLCLYLKIYLLISLVGAALNHIFKPYIFIGVKKLLL